MDIAAVSAAPAPDASCVSAETGPSRRTGPTLPAGARESFDALLNEAASAEPESIVDEKDEVAELAAMLAMTSLQSLCPMVPATPVAENDETIAAIDEIASDDIVSCQAVPIDSRIGPNATSDMADNAGGTKSDETASPDELAAVASPNTTSTQSAVETTTDTMTVASETGTSIETAAKIGESLTANARIENPRDRATAVAGNTNAAAATKSIRASKQSRAEAANAVNHAGDQTPVAQGASSSAIRAAVEEIRAAARVQSSTETPGPTSAAARFARALERAASMTTENTSSEASSQANINNTGDQPSSSFRDGSNDRPMPSSGSSRHDGAPGVSFMVSAASALDPRMLTRAVDAASHATDATLATNPERDVVAQLVQSMRVQFRDGIGEAVLKLKPEHLGAVQIALKVENGTIAATVHAEVAAVRQWLESHQDTLRTSLAEQGLRLERFVVEPDAERQTPRDDAQPREQRRQHQRSRESATMSDKNHPVFEVTV